MVKVTEDDKDVIASWYDEARSPNMTADALPGFIRQVVDGYQHDYGTICHAIAACALAAATAANRMPLQGGITGFQSGAVMWEFIRKWTHEDGPMRLIKFSDMLWPQYEQRFTTKKISRSNFKWLQERAARELADHPSSHAAEHLKSIVGGKAPFGYTIQED